MAPVRQGQRVKKGDLPKSVKAGVSRHRPAPKAQWHKDLPVSQRTADNQLPCPVCNTFWSQHQWRHGYLCNTCGQRRDRQETKARRLAEQSSTSGSSSPPTAVTPVTPTSPTPLSRRGSWESLLLIASIPVEEDPEKAGFLGLLAAAEILEKLSG